MAPSHRLIVFVLAAAICLGFAAPSQARFGPESTSGVSGWTALNPSADSRVVYVSTSGSDANSGLSAQAPLRTISAGYSMMRAGYPDWLLFKAGDTWTGERFFWDKSGRSLLEPMVISSYGNGPRPVFISGSGTGFTSAQANLAIVGLHFKPAAGVIITDNVKPNGIEMITGMQPMGNILIEDCKMEGYIKGIVVDWFQGAAPFNYRIRRCVIVDCYNTGQEHCAGAYLAGIQGLLVDQCIFDHNGWREEIPGAVPNIFRRNLYVQGNCAAVTIRDNIFARSAAEGFQLRCGGVAEGNLCLRNGVSGIFIAGAGQVRNNVLLDSRDLDANTARGMGIDAQQMISGSVAGNICAYRTTPASAWGFIAIMCASSSTSGSVACHDNLVYDWEYGSDAGCCYVIGPTVAFYQNTAIQPQGSTLVDCWTGQPNSHLGDNHYWSTGATPFYLDGTGQNLTWNQWRAWSGDTSSVFSPQYQPASAPTIGSYAASQGAPPTLEAFLAICRQQSRATWRDAFSAIAANEYFRAGFGRPAVLPCPGDFNHDGRVDVQDVMSFWNMFAAGNMSADLNGDATLNLSDIQVIQQSLATGCP